MRSAAALLLISATLVPSARAETVLGIGGLAVEGRVVKLDAEGRLVIEPARQGATVRVALAEVAEINYASAGGSTEVQSSRTIVFNNGDRLQGDVVGLKDGKLHLTNPRLGRLAAPLGELRGFLHPRKGVAAKLTERVRAAVTSEAGVTEDVLYLANGDCARGVIHKLAGGRVEFEHLLLKKRVMIDLHDAIGLRFASIPGEKRPAEAEAGGVIAVLETRDGSRLSGPLRSASSEKLTIAWVGGISLAVPVRDLRRAAFRGGRLVWLSDLEPAKRSEVPLLGPRFRLSLDHTSAGKELAIAGRRFRRGLATRSKSSYTWRLAGHFDYFESYLGIDDGAGSEGEGCVVFRVLVDGKEKFNSGPVRGAGTARYVRVDLNGAKELKLCVDEGKGLDLADHAVWAEAHLIRPAGAGKKAGKTDSGKRP